MHWQYSFPLALAVEKTIFRSNFRLSAIVIKSSVWIWNWHRIGEVRISPLHTCVSLRDWQRNTWIMTLITARHWRKQCLALKQGTLCYFTFYLYITLCSVVGGCSPSNPGDARLNPPRETYFFMIFLFVEIMTFFFRPWIKERTIFISTNIYCWC